MKTSSPRFALSLPIMFAAIAVAAGLTTQPPADQRPVGGKAAAMLTEARSHLEAREFDKALGVLEKAKRAERDDPDILTAYGLALRGSGRLDEARESFHAVLKLRTGSHMARRLLGEVYLDLASEQLASLRTAGPVAKEDAAALLAACVALPEKVQPAPPTKK
ncbi:MAG: tetratricopeptide repeat protein [Phycisphaerales bacterium]